MKYGICNEIFSGWTWDDTVDFAASLGYHGIEIAPFTFADSVEDVTAHRRREILLRARSRNLEIIGLHWLLRSPEGLSLTTKDEETRRATVDYLKSLVAFCADLEGRFMVLGSPAQRNITYGATYSEALGRMKSAMLEVLPLAREKNVYILVEPLSEKETNLLTSAKEAVGFIQDTGHPNLGLHLDVKAMSSEGEPVPGIIDRYGVYARHIHVNDPDLSGPGFGELDYVPIRKALERVGYEGYLSVEVFDFSPGPEVIAEKSIDYLKSVFEKREKGEKK